MTANGVRLFYTRAGAGKPLLVLVPGWCCDHTTMSPLAERLESSFEVLGLDLRGMGQSEFPGGPFTMADLVEDLCDLCEKLGVRHPILIGHSLGGRVVLATLQAHPHFAPAAVLLDVAVEESPEKVVARRAEVEGEDWRAALQRRFGNLMPQGAGNAQRDLVEQILDTPIDAARALLRASDDFDATVALSGCPLPVLYVGASEPRESLTRLVQLKADIFFGQVVGSGHFVQIDAAGQVAAMVDRFVALVAQRQSTMRQ
jgi:sigma-B regulation protein RsbQ